MNQPPYKIENRLAEIITVYHKITFFRKILRTLVLMIASPTLLFAKSLKPDRSYCRSIVIVSLNLFYLIFSLITVAFLIFYLDNSLAPIRAHACYGWCVWAWFLASRCIEVLIAFYRDAMDKLRDKPAASDLTPSRRVWLALNSYVELIVNYAMLYALLPEHMWSDFPTKITDVLWISVSTITTSGSAGYSPTHWLPQLISTSEIVGGVILLVVCFTIYAGGKPEKQQASVSS